MYANNKNKLNRKFPLNNTQHSNNLITFANRVYNFVLLSDLIVNHVQAGYMDELFLGVKCCKKALLSIRFPGKTIPTFDIL